MNGIGSLKFVGLDSNLFIYHFENNSDFSPLTTGIFERLTRGSLKAITSIISIIETLSFPAPRHVIKNLEEAFAAIPNLSVIDVNYQIALEAAKIRRDYKIRTPDSIQLATALTNKVQAFVTNDGRLKKFDRLSVILLTDL